MLDEYVLNLIITGIPSIPTSSRSCVSHCIRFKPYYNWNTFNTYLIHSDSFMIFLGFKPYYNWNTFNTLNDFILELDIAGFKPYYNWNTFNTIWYRMLIKRLKVLNLIITGIPSILFTVVIEFKVGKF